MCKSWASIISRCVYELGAKYNGSIISDAILRRAPLTKKLYVWNNVRPISNEGLQGLAALTSLTLKTAQRGTPGLLNRSILTGLSNLTHLDCSFAYHLPVSMPKLEYLKISNNELVTGDELVNYTRLHTLDVWECRELSPLHVGRMTNLCALTFHIREERQEESTHFLSHLTSLTSLELVNCNRVDEASIARLTSLTSLDLYFSDAGNRIMTYSFLEGLTSLTRLIIFDREAPRDHITPAWVTKLALPASLTTLDLHCNFAHTIIGAGEGISHLSNLTNLSTNTALNLTHNLLACLPNLVHLHTIGLSAPSSLWSSARDRFLTLECKPIFVIDDERRKK